MTPEEFRDWRKRQGMTQAQAAAALGLGLSTIELYERGKREGRKVEIPKTVRLAMGAIASGLTDYPEQ